MMINNDLHSDLPIPPGEFLEEVLEDLGMTKDELAKRMSRPAAKLSAIFKGEKAITPDTALQLEKVVGVPAHIWTGLEAEFRLVQARQQAKNEQEKLKHEAHLITPFRYSDLAKMGYVDKKQKSTDKVLELQKFFGVTSLKTVLELKNYQPAFRAGKQGRSPEAVASWLRIGELESRKIDCQPFNKERLIKLLPQFRSMTKQPPEKFERPLNESLACSGVALVICPELSGTYANGATFWLNNQKAVAMMTIRYRWSDIFWFSFFHELAHIILHRRKLVILEGNNDEPAQKELEEEANTFAADILIPREEYSVFIQNNRFFKGDIKLFASKMGIAPGIVVGRLQKEKRIEHSWHNDLRQRFKWSSN